MSFSFYTCTVCKRSAFPQRYRCFHCGSTTFDSGRLQQAAVVACTEAHRRPDDSPYRYLVELHAPDIDLRLIAVSDFPPASGETVQVHLSETGITYIQR